MIVWAGYTLERAKPQAKKKCAKRHTIACDYKQMLLHIKKRLMHGTKRLKNC